MKNLTLWLLGGAFAASLTWNWRSIARDTPSHACAEPACCASFDTGELGLSAEQQAALTELCARSCCASDELERQADELQRTLIARLSQPAVDVEAARDAVREVADVRRRSLEACVDGILAVRKVLTPLQVEALLQGCASGAGCASGTQSCR